MDKTGARSHILIHRISENLKFSNITSLYVLDKAKSRQVIRCEYKRHYPGRSRKIRGASNKSTDYDKVGQPASSCGPELHDTYTTPARSAPPPRNACFIISRGRPIDLFSALNDDPTAYLQER